MKNTKYAHSTYTYKFKCEWDGDFKPQTIKTIDWNY